MASVAFAVIYNAHHVCHYHTGENARPKHRLTYAVETRPLTKMTLDASEPCFMADKK